MPTPSPFPVESQPGIKRDCTQLEGGNYSDGTWCRFTARARPKKIAGYTAITSHLDQVIRGMDSFTADQVNYVHLGSQSELTQVQVSLMGALGVQNLRTPAGFVPDANNLWQFTAMQNKVSGRTVLIAHASHSLTDIANTDETVIYYGNADDTTPLVASGMDPVSGGVVSAAPYLIAFGNGGRVDISALNDPTAATANSTFVTPQKIVKGLPLRNSTGPAVVLWSLDSVVTGFFDPSLTAAAGGIPTFDFAVVDGESSILSEQSVVQFDAIYYWIGVDRFLQFNGVVRELPNNMNIDFFFKTLNFAYRQKVFAMKVPRWGEIWWCYPSGNATECNHAIVYNVRLNIWYDTPLPDGGRSAGLFAKVYNKPFMCDVDLTSTGYTLWQHETGVDKVIGGRNLAIKSNYTTHEISPTLVPAGQGGADKAFGVSIVEPDFLQTGNLRMTVKARQNARTTVVDEASVIIPEMPTDGSDPTANDQVARVKANARLLAFQFESNEQGGDYEHGHVMAHIMPTDGRVTR